MGKVLWNVPLGARVHADLILANNTIYAATDKTDVLIVALSLEGQRKWTFSPPKK
jgi:outer membrane protein assembly factor BamB